MNSRYYWYSQHKAAVDTVARCLSIELSELLPALDERIKRRQWTLMQLVSKTLPSTKLKPNKLSTGNKRPSNLTIFNDEYIYDHNRVENKASVLL